MGRNLKQLEELKNLVNSQTDQNKNKNSEIEYYKNREKELEEYKVELGNEITKMNEIIEKLKKEIEEYRIRKLFLLQKIMVFDKKIQKFRMKKR